MTLPPNSQTDSHELLERGRLSLQAIEYQERAARYHAAAATLRAAMLQAENGNSAKLQEWLELHSSKLDSEMNLPDLAIPSDSTSEAIRSKRWVRIDQPNAGEPSVREQSISNKAIDNPTIGALNSGNSGRDLEEPVSPWSRMEKAAKERLEKEPPQKPDKAELLFEQFEQLEQLFESEELEPTEEQSVSAASPALANALLLPDEMQFAISNLDRKAESPSIQNWLRAPHVWISLVLHFALIVCLGFLVFSVASEPKVLSIVAAYVEAENVLIETPMEMISELDSTPEPLQSAPTPNLAGLTTDLGLADVPLAAGSLSSPPASMASQVAGASSNSMQTSMNGSKTLTGAEFFGVKATGNTFVYIVDSSPSMRRDGAFEAARSEIIRSLTSMKPKQRYFISFFGKEIDPMVLEMGLDEKYPVYANPENLTKTIDWMKGVQVQKEGLPPNNALAEAIDMQPDGIFLLFDGDTKVDVAKYLRRVNRSDDVLNFGTPKIPIHVIHFFQDEFQKQMRQVAEENGGTYRFISRPPKGKR